MICIFLELLILFWHTSMFPACRFHQRTYVAKGHMNGAPSETLTHSYRFVSGMFYRFCNGLYKGQCSGLDFSFFSFLSLSQSVSTGLSCWVWYPNKSLIFDMLQSSSLLYIKMNRFANGFKFGVFFYSFFIK